MKVGHDNHYPLVFYGEGRSLSFNRRPNEETVKKMKDLVITYWALEDEYSRLGLYPKPDDYNHPFNKLSSLLFLMSEEVVSYE